MTKQQNIAEIRKVCHTNWKHIIQWFKDYLNSRCWHEYMYVRSYSSKKMNEWGMPVKVVTDKCKKCGSFRNRLFSK